MMIDSIVASAGHVGMRGGEAAGGGWAQGVGAGEAGWRRRECAIRD